MTRHPQAAVDDAAQTIRDRVMRGIALNRNPGLHFPGYFLDFEWVSIANGNARIAIADGPHCRNAQGEVDISALAVLADTALGTSARQSLAPGARLATMYMQLQFTGASATGPVTSEGRLLGFASRLTVRQALSTATLYVNDAILAHASGQFAALDPPPGVNMAPLPWQEARLPEARPLDEQALEPHERSVLQACDTALANASPKASFIQHLWDGIPDVNDSGATGRVAIGPHLGNRVGHVQGGITLGIAATHACAAAPAKMMLSNVSAWYVSPGRGDELRISSRVVHAGRTIAVVRTEIKNSAGERVLEAVSQHVARSH